MLSISQCFLFTDNDATMKDANISMVIPIIIELNVILINCGRYGKDWDRYQKLVPYRIIPYVY